MIYVEYTPAFLNLAKRMRSAGKSTTIKSILREVFSRVGSAFRADMVREFSVFSGETKGAVGIMMGNFGEAEGNGFTIMEVGIPAGKLGRNQGFFENMDRRESYDKCIPLSDPYFTRWVASKFPHNSTAQLRQITAAVGKKIMQRRTSSGGKGVHALEKAYEANKSLIDAACRDFMNTYTAMMTSDETGGVTY